MAVVSVDADIISLPPTFFIHMTNELEEYLGILEYLLAKQPPPLTHPIHHHLLWVSDAIGYADTLACRVDPAEANLKENGECFSRAFKELYLNAVEIKGYLRTGEEEFPALTRYNFQVENEILHFNNYLCKLLGLVESARHLVGPGTRPYEGPLKIGPP